MNEQLQESLAELINKSMAGFDSATSFLQAEIPDVVRQLLLWHGVKSFLFWFFGLSIMIFLVCIRKKAHRIMKKFDDEAHCYNKGWVYVVGYGALAVVSIPGFALFSENFEWLQIWLAPKVYLIEYTANLVK